MNNIKVFALGGLSEVGKNMYCIEQDNEIIIIDSGIGFPEGDFGINVVLPDYTYLKQNEGKIIGLFITHGHEDHIGGIPFLLSQVRIPKIYANAFSIKLIQSKLKETSYANDIDNLIEEYNNSSIYNFNNFSISFFRTNHSIPDSYGIAIKTNLGYIIHTGDFKFDLTPISNEFDYNKLTEYSKENILLLLSDSTNASINKQSISEKKVSTSLKNQFSYINGRIIIATFASNTVRISQILEAANACNRKVIIFGRSIEKSISVASSLNYMKIPRGIFLTQDEFPYIDDDKVVILSTGTQGEPLASLSRIANGTHKFIKIKHGDTVIFSSSAIPGNQLKINRIVNKLYQSGAEVISNSPLSDVHSSGHAYANELQLMLNLCKPKYFMPIHGEFSMLYSHVRLATEVGLRSKNCFILNNGDVLNINEDGANIEGKVQSGNVFVDEKNYIVENDIMRERKQLSENGIVSFTVVLDNNEIKSLPTIASRGFAHNKSSRELFNAIQYKAFDIVKAYLDNTNDIDLKELEKIIITQTSEFIISKTGRNPIVSTNILKK